jgi:hypothetical protein
MESLNFVKVALLRCVKGVEVQIGQRRIFIK